MADALREVDGIGFGRAAAQEPDLVRDILSGAVTGIMEYTLDEANMGGRLALASYQLRQMAKGEDPIDGTDLEAVDKVFQSLSRPPRDL
jgi:hypothetical protein